MVAGGYAYGYLFMSQNTFAQRVFEELLGIIKPSRILEIGTFHGGLTLMISDILNNLKLYDTVIRTYDINNQEFLKPLVKDRKIEIFTENLFNDNYTNFINDEAKTNIYNFIQGLGTSMILCDGGCKKCEFNLISPLLKQHDVIMAHDYAPNQQYFDASMKHKIWDWLEIQDNDINTCVLKNNLIPFHQDLAQLAAWCCKIKN